MSSQKKSVFKTVTILFIFAIALMAFTMMWHKSQNAEQQPVQSSTQNNYTQFPAPRDLTAFNLTTDKNKHFTQENLKNHWTLMFFGFTHCPHVCPATMSVMRDAYPKLLAQYPNLQVVLVTVDPERDTIRVLNKYVNSFNTNFIGATGSSKNLKQLEKQLGVYAEREKTNDKNYSVDHTDSIFLINPEGQWTALLPFGLKSAELENSFTKIAKLNS